MPKNEEVSLASLGIQMPYSMQAEQSVLGAALVDETVLNRLITDMEPEMFYSDQNRAIYETMRSLYTESEAVDIVTLVNALASNKTFASADDAKVYLARIAETLPSVSNVDSYFKIVKEKYQGRRLIDAARSILNETASGEDADLLLESAEQKIYDIRSGRDKSGVKTIRESILEVIDTMQKLSGADRDKFAGIPTGFNYLDTVLTGLGRSDLIILAARPGMGKTSFALNIATNVARQQKVPTIIFSLEMTCEQLTDRILSSTANIDSQAFRTGRLNITSISTCALPRPSKQAQANQSPLPVDVYSVVRHSYQHPFFLYLPLVSYLKALVNVATIAAIVAVMELIPIISESWRRFLSDFVGTTISHPGWIKSLSLFLARATVPFR